MSIDFNCKTTYDDKYIKTKIKTYADITVFKRMQICTRKDKI